MRQPWISGFGSTTTLRTVPADAPTSACSLASGGNDFTASPVKSIATMRPLRSSAPPMRVCATRASRVGNGLSQPQCIR